MKHKKNKRGFTLTELIIVMVIIAILAAFLLPQYLGYVERSRQAVDVQTAGAIIRSVSAAMNDPETKVPPGVWVKVTWYTNSDPGALNGFYPGVGAIGLAAASGDHSDLDNDGAYGGEVQKRFRYAVCDSFNLITPGYPEPDFTNGASGFRTTGMPATSTLGKSEDFIFEIYTTTGEIRNVSSAWAQMGID